MKIQIRPIEKLVLYARTNPTNKVEPLIRPSLWVPANGKSTARGVKEKISMEIRGWPIAVRGLKSCTRERAAFGSGRC